MRVALVTLVVVAFVLPSQAQRGPRGFGRGALTRFPFDQWARENAKPQIKWNVRVGPPVLSGYQRLQSQIRVEVDGSEILKRHDSGQLILLARIEDGHGGRWQTTNAVDLSHFPKSALARGTSFDKLSYYLNVFVLPGHYTISIAVCDARTLEHSFGVRVLDVAEVKNDPLPDAWRGLQAVEFAQGTSAVETSFPVSRSPWSIPVETANPVRIDVMVNMTPTQAGMASAAMFRRNMSVLLPTVEALCRIAPRGGTLSLHMLDLARHRIAFDQEVWNAGQAAPVDWRGLDNAVRDSEKTTATIDVESLAGQRSMLDYLRREVAMRMNSEGKPQVLIVLGASAYFDKQERGMLPPVPLDAGQRIFYIRQDFVLEQSSFADDVERVLRPFGSRAFGVTKPEHVRRAMGEIVSAISQF